MRAEEELKNLLKSRSLKPSKRLGQHFLADKTALKKIIQAAELKKTDVILEIGPGPGTLTKELAKMAKKVIACEKDPKMCQILEENLKDFKNLEIIRGDILTTNNQQLAIKKYKVVANLPFYITAPAIRKFLEAKNQPRLMVLIVQKEIAQRICARPPRMSILAISVQFYAKPEIISYVSRSSFWPQPKVDGAILRIVPRINAGRKLINANMFFKIVKAGFLQPRKYLTNNLSKGLKINKEKVKIWLLKNEIKPEQRAETLSVEDWLKLLKTMTSKNC